MGHFIDGEKGKVNVTMYPSKTIGISFPTDGNRHNEDWHTVFEQYGIRIFMHLGEKGPELISIEVELSEAIKDLETRTYA